MVRGKCLSNSACLYFRSNTFISESCQWHILQIQAWMVEHVILMRWYYQPSPPLQEVYSLASVWHAKREKWRKSKFAATVNSKICTFLGSSLKTQQQTRNSKGCNKAFWELRFPDCMTVAAHRVVTIPYCPCLQLPLICRY